MNTGSIKKRAAAVLLLLVFFQQMGAGLYVHNLFHEKEQAGQIASRQQVDSKEINIACSCVDDFLMPFVDADTTIVLPFNEPHLTPCDFFSEKIYFTSLIFTSLRGPPTV